MDIEGNKSRPNDILNRVELDLKPMEERVIRGLMFSYDLLEDPVVLDEILNERDKDKVYDEMAYKMSMLVENYEREEEKESKRG